MQIEGIHHISAITGDGPGNVDFYARILGLRLVKKTVNQDNPGVYHLFYADEAGSPGADLTFFVYPGLPLGSAGNGMVERIGHRVASVEALDYWADRLGGEGIELRRSARDLLFADPEGLRHQLSVTDVPDVPLIARHAEVPAAFALQGFDAVHVLAADPSADASLLESALGFIQQGEGQWEARGSERGGRIITSSSDQRGRPGAGTVHHVAWSVNEADMPVWRDRMVEAGMHPTPVIDRFWFRSVYFRVPTGVLFELASVDSGGFTLDEPLDHLGEHLILPPALETQRGWIEAALEPLPDVRRWRPAPVTSGSEQ